MSITIFVKLIVIDLSLMTLFKYVIFKFLRKIIRFYIYNEECAIGRRVLISTFCI